MCTTGMIVSRGPPIAPRSSEKRGGKGKERKGGGIGRASEPQFVREDFPQRGEREESKMSALGTSSTAAVTPLE